jgi:hypothetical protein
MSHRSSGEEKYEVPDFESLEDLNEVPLINVSKSGDSEHEYEWKFRRAYVDDIDGKLEYKGRVYKEGVYGVWSFYNDTAPVLISQDKVYAHPDSDRWEASRQAYFAVSILTDYGIVKGFDKQ